MKAQTSVFLDLLRFCAALAVAFDHIGDYTNGLLWPLGAFGVPAVDVFFVLSGYVIAHATARGNTGFRHYIVNRAARLYSVVVPALAISFALGIAGTYLRPDVDWGDTSLVAYTRCLLFTNELWFSNVTPGTNGPFWSLGYEAWYYLMFAALCFCKGSRRIALIVLCAALAGPRILLMAPLWLMGVAACAVQTRVSIGRTQARLLWPASLAVSVALVWWHVHRITGAHPPPDMTPAVLRTLTDWPSYLADYAIGLLVAATILLCNLAAGPTNTLVRIAAPPVHWLAGATFTLYLLHVPVAQFLAALSPWPAGNPTQQIFVTGVTFALVFLVAQFTERRKAPWRTMLNHVVPI